MGNATLRVLTLNIRVLNDPLSKPNKHVAKSVFHKISFKRSKREDEKEERKNGVFIRT